MCPQHWSRADPFEKLGEAGPQIADATGYFCARCVPTLWVLIYRDPLVLAELQAARVLVGEWNFGSQGTVETVINPANGQEIGKVRFLSRLEAQQKVEKARPWAQPTKVRSETLRKVADIYEKNAQELFALLTREAGKTLPDCIGELREAVDFLRYYAAQAEKDSLTASGIFTCISPWNFPLAIFTGQIAAASGGGQWRVGKACRKYQYDCAFRH